MKVAELMEEPVVLKPGESVARFVSLLEKGFHEAAVVSRGRYLGVVNYREVASKGVSDPTKTKVSSVLSHPPVLSPEDGVREAAEKLLHSPYRSLPVVSGGRLVGMVFDTDIVGSVSSSKEFRKTPVEEVMSPAVVINQKDDIGKARVLMREKGISRLPVVNDEGELVGLVTVTDLLKAVKPRERISWYSMAAEKLTLMNIPVSVIMNPNPVTISRDTSLSEAADLMRSRKISGLVVSNGGVIGVVTVRDLLEFYLSLSEKPETRVQVTGCDDPGARTLVERFAEKTRRMVPLNFVHLRVKTYRKEGRKKYSVRLRVNTDRGTFVSRAHSWDLLEAVGDAIDQAERIIVRKKEKLRDKILRVLRRMKP